MIITLSCSDIVTYWPPYGISWDAIASKNDQCIFQIKLKKVYEIFEKHLTNYCALVDKAPEEAGEDYMNNAGSVLIPTLAPYTTESIVCQGKSDGDKCYRGCFTTPSPLRIILPDHSGVHQDRSVRCQDTFGKCRDGICRADIVYPTANTTSGNMWDMLEACPRCRG